MIPRTPELPLVAVVGPTASGKSALGVWLAEQFGGEVLACDSTQLYRGFDIGTAKPGVPERRGITHHLIDNTYRIRGHIVLALSCKKTRLFSEGEMIPF